MANGTDQKILQAFNQLVIKQGYRGTTTRQIAAKAGINESTVFRHFATKEAILDTQLALSTQNLKKVIGDFKFTNDLESDISQMGKEYVDYVERHPALFLTGVRDSYQYPKIRDGIQRLPEQMMKLLTSRLQREYRIKITEPARRALQNLFLMLFGRVIMKLTYPDFKYLGSDHDFFEENFAGLVHYCVRQINLNNK